jgi:hypothetical protein
MQIISTEIKSKKKLLEVMENITILLNDYIYD